MIFLIENKSSNNFYCIAHTLSENKNESNASENLETSPSTTNQLKSTKTSTSLEFSQTPKKYRRRPLTQDEIDLVTVRISDLYLNNSAQSVIF